MEPISGAMAAAGGLSAVSAINPYAAALGVIPEAVKIGTAIKQKIEADRIRKSLVRPTMTVPGSVQQATEAMRLGVMDTRIPGQGAYEQQLQRGLASTIQGAQNMGGGSGERLATLVAANDNTNQGVQNLALMGLNQQAADINNFTNQSNLQGQYEQQAWEWNKQKKFQDAAAMAAALGDASNKNLYSGLTNAGGSIAAGLTQPQGEAPSMDVTPSAPIIPTMATRQAPLFNPNQQVPMREGMANLVPSIPMYSNEAAFQAELEDIKRVENSTLPTMKTRPAPSLMPVRPNYTPLVNISPIQGYKDRR